MRGFGQPAGPRVPLRTAVSEETAKKLGFGKSPDGTPIGPDDFAVRRLRLLRSPVPQGVVGFDFQVDAAIGADRDQVFRITIGDREDGPRGIPTRAFVGDPAKRRLPHVQSRRPGVRHPAAAEFAISSPRPPTKIPLPSPSTAPTTCPSTTTSIQRVKYIRDDRFVYEHMLDDATRVRAR